MLMFGGVLLALGINGLFPIASYATWQMPLWMSVGLIVIGGLLVTFSPSGYTQEAEQVPPQPRQHSDEC